MRFLLSLSIAAVLLAACGTDTTPAPTPAATPSATPGGTAADPDARDAYRTAMCPLFLDILATDPRLAALRRAGAEGGSMVEHVGDIDAMTAELGAVLESLDEVPDWQPGRQLRFQLMAALHAIRTQLLVVSRDPDAAGAAESLAAVPYVASVAVDRAMARAVEGGLACADG